MVTTRYSDQQGSKSRQKVMRLYKQWDRPISKRFIKPPYSISRAASIDPDCCRLPMTSVLSNNADKLHSNRMPTIIIVIALELQRENRSNSKREIFVLNISSRAQNKWCCSAILAGKQ